MIDLKSGRFVLPGTHSKWIVMRDGKVTDFLTAMTGELFDVISSHTLFAQLIQNEPQSVAFHPAALAPK